MKILAILLSLFVLSCGNNAHYTGELGASSVSAALALPDVIGVGFNLELAGTCEPSGIGTITVDSSPSGDFSPAPLTCDCVNGAIANCVDPSGGSVTSVTFPGNGPNGTNPNIVTTITDPISGLTATDNPETTIAPQVDLLGQTSGVLNAPASPFVATGSCSYAGNAPTATVTITDSTGSMMPSTITCVCQGPGAVGTLDCSGSTPVTFSSENPVLTATIDDGVTTTTDDTPVDVNVDPVIDLAPPAGMPFEVGDTIPLVGTCASAGDSISIPNPSPSGLSPAGPQTCVCDATGNFSCPSYTLTSFGMSPVFRATITDANGQTASDDEGIMTVGPTLSVTKALIAVNANAVTTGAGVFAGDTVVYSVGVSNNGIADGTNISLDDGCPVDTTATGTFNAGTGAYASGSWTVPTLAASGGSDTLTFECTVNNGLSTGSVDNAIAAVSSAETGSVPLTGVGTTNPIQSPAIDLMTGVTPAGPNTPTTLPSNMGSCAPDGGSVTLSDANGSMDPNPVVCACTAGAIDCSVVSVTFTSEDADLSATVSANGVGPVSDSDPSNDPDVPVSPTITIDDLDGGATLTDGDSFDLSGTCQSAGDSIVIPDPGPAGLYTWLATATDGSCVCSTAGTYNCGSVTIADGSAGPSNAITATITDQDGITPESAQASDVPAVLGPSFDLVKTVSPTGNIYAGDTITYTLSLTNDNVATTSVSLDDDCPSPSTFTGTSLPSIGTYASGTWTIGSMAAAANETLEIECQVPNGTTPQIATNTVSTIAANGGSYTPSGTTIVSNDIINPEVDLSTGPTIPAGGADNVSLPSNMGSCSPDGATVNVNSARMSPMNATCTCTAGAIDCSIAPEGPFDFTTADPSFTATIENGGVGPIADSHPANDPTVNVDPVVDLVEVATTHLNAGDEVEIKGTCSSPGDAIVVTNPSSNFVPASLSCSCGGAGNFDCGVFTVDAGIVLQDEFADDVTFTAKITDTDGDTGMDDELMDCVREGLIASSGTLTYGTTYNVVENGQASIHSFDTSANGDIRFQENSSNCKSPSCSIDVIFSEPIPLRLTNTISFPGNVWERTDGGCRYCVDAGSSPLTYTAGTVDPALDFTSFPGCADATLTSAGEAFVDWGRIDSTNTTSINIYYRATDSYNFTAVTCGVNP